MRAKRPVSQTQPPLVRATQWRRERLAAILSGSQNVRPPQPADCRRYQLVAATATTPPYTMARTTITTAASAAPIQKVLREWHPKPSFTRE